MPQKYKLVAILASTAAAGLSGAVIAGAADTATPTTPSAQQQDRPDRGGPGRGGPREDALTGETKTKVEAAALAKVPGGTVKHSSADPAGGYRAHVEKSDGTDVDVKVDKDFKVTSVDTPPAGGPGRGGPGGPGGGPGADLAATAKALDVTEAKLRSAVEAARPDKPADADKTDRRDERAAEIAKALGESQSAVSDVLEANRPTPPASGERPDGPPKDGGPRDGGPRGGGPGGRGPGADDAKLVTALAKKFSISETKVKTALESVRKAHEADHEQREDARYAAIAKALGKSAADVKKAFEANRPAKPAAPAAPADPAATPAPTPTP